MTLTAGWVQAVAPDAAIEYDALDIRQWFSALNGGEGVCGPVDFRVSQRAAGATFALNIGDGRAVVNGDSEAFQGAYIVTNTADLTDATSPAAPTVPAAPGSGTRIHRVVLRIHDRAADGGSTYVPTVDVLADTGSGTPAEPDSAITLAFVSVSAGQSSVTNANITDARSFAFGPVAPVLHRSARATLAGPVSNIPSVAVQVAGVGGSFTLTEPTRVLMEAEGQFYLGTPGAPVAADSMGRLEIRLGSVSYRNIALQCPFANVGAHFSAGRDELLTAGTYTIGLWLSKEDFGTQSVSLDGGATPIQLRVTNLGLA